MRLGTLSGCALRVVLAYTGHDAGTCWTSTSGSPPTTNSIPATIPPGAVQFPGSPAPRPRRCRPRTRPPDRPLTCQCVSRDQGSDRRSLSSPPGVLLRPRARSPRQPLPVPVRVPGFSAPAGTDQVPAFVRVQAGASPPHRNAGRAEPGKMCPSALGCHRWSLPSAAAAPAREPGRLCADDPYRAELHSRSRVQRITPGLRLLW